MIHPIKNGPIFLIFRVSFAKFLNSRIQSVHNENSIVTILKETIVIDNLTFDIVNIGSGIPTSVENFARKQIALNKWMIDLKNTPNREREYEPKSFWADVSRLNKILDGTE